MVGAAADDVDAVLADVDGVDRVGQRSVEFADQRAVERLPEADLAVGAGRDDLVLERVIRDVLEERVGAQHVKTRPLTVSANQPAHSE